MRGEKLSQDRSQCHPLMKNWVAKQVRGNTDRHAVCCEDLELCSSEGCWVWGREKNRGEVQGGSEIKGSNGTGVNDDIKSTSDEQRQKTEEWTVGEEKSKKKIMDENTDKERKGEIKQRRRMRIEEEENRGKNQGAERKDETV
ncbi:hypothetical protein NDU88_004270 [Pleurodeles waltl]|uniref:Uncharacterized protein n=1 Tax=Pleurodeles waltl TaxID=8319 RepID=A0AAV7NKJ1_PLEWA|nr:hypothetical protein NDU88_004270 [Pleurodeles waltl]